MTERYADVIIDIAHEKVDRIFQYRIPEELAEAVQPGVRVHVPFGRGNQEKVGYVVDISEETDYPLEKIKSVASVDEKGISAESRQIQIAYWLKSQYGSTMIAALKTAQREGLAACMETAQRAAMAEDAAMRGSGWR